MTEVGKFNTDPIALTRRIQAHEKYGLSDLNDWIFSHIDLVKGLSILDLGCGTGKQTIPIAQLIGDTGRVLAVDISEDALHTLSSVAKGLLVEKSVSVSCCGLDDIDKQLHEQSFDRVLSSYSLYYAQNPRRVFSAVHRVLEANGIFFFCGPAKDNNLELKQFHYTLKGERVPPGQGASVFMEELGQQLAREFFDKVEVLTFQNPLHFDAPEALYDYWSSHNLYDEELDEAFRSSAAGYFQGHSVFETVKRVVGVKATHPSTLEQ